MMNGSSKKMAPKMTDPNNSTMGMQIPFPWKAGMFGKGSIVGPDKWPDYLGKKVTGPDSRKGNGMGGSMGTPKFK
jgi:hypothetical protein